MYIVQEVQTNSENQISILSYQYETINEADSKFYLILSSAAVSTLPVHSAVLMTNEGVTLAYKFFDRRTNTPIEMEGGNE